MRTTLSRDIPASFVVFLVALPLCMGIAIASGVPPERGLLTAIVGGIVVGLISGAPLQVSGPAAGLVVMVFDIVQSQGIGALGPVLLVAGAFQCVAGVLRLGQWFRAISPAVVHGMLAAIGVLIVAGQLHVLIDRKPLASGLDNLMALPSAMIALLPLDGGNDEAALLVGVVTIVVMVAWERFRTRALRHVPSALLGVLAGTTLAACFALPVNRVGIPDNLWDAVTPLDGSLFNQLSNPTIWLAALALAVVASAETLLSASAIDRMQHRVRTRYNRELFAQGVGNALCGVLGGLPMTGVIVRSSANVQAGAMTRCSTVLHGLLILGCVTLAPGALRMVPTASLAGVLMVIGWRLVSLHHVKALFLAHGRMPVAIWVVTSSVIVATDLLTGVLAGLVLSVTETLPQVRRLAFRIRRVETKAGTELRLTGTGSFLRLPHLLSMVEAIPPDRDVRIRTRGLWHIDHTFASALQEISQRGSATDRRVIVV